MALILNLLWRF